MYTLVSAVGKLASGKGRWQDVDIGEVIVSQLFIDYSAVIAVLSNPVIPNQVALNLEDIRAEAAGLNVTFNQFLIDNGNKTLPTSNTLPKLETKYATYMDAFHAGYAVTPIRLDTSVDTDLPTSAKESVKLTRVVDTDWQLFGESILPTVNGFYHLLDWDTSGAYVIDAMRTAYVSGRNQLGLHSFRELGKIKCIPLKENMVYKQIEDQPLYDAAYLKVEGYDLSKYTVMLVVGGYLYVDEDQSFKVVGDHTIKFDFKNSSYINRIFESKPYIDLSPLGLSEYPNNPTQVMMEELTSDAVITKYLTLSQSYVVLLDKQDVYVERETVKAAKIPGQYISGVYPKWPLQVGVGMMADYWAIADDGQWALNAFDGFFHNRVYYTRDPKDLFSIADSRISIDPVRYANGRFLKICADI